MDESDHNIIEYTDDGNTNDSTVQNVEIQEILSPQRGKPQTLRAMLYKMVNNDKLNRVGFLSLLIVPSVCVIIAYLLSE